MKVDDLRKVWKEADERASQTLKKRDEGRTAVLKLRQEAGESSQLVPYRAASLEEWDKIKSSPHDQFFLNLGPPKRLMNPDPTTTWMNRSDFDFNKTTEQTPGQKRRSDETREAFMRGVTKALMETKGNES